MALEQIEDPLEQLPVGVARGADGRAYKHNEVAAHDLGLRFV
jgi:hypothetical protein